MSIGLRTLGGDPEGFYALELHRQVDILAVLQIERENAAQPKGKRGRKVSIEDRVSFASDDARQFWGPVFQS